jgi:hypothetical protein
MNNKTRKAGEGKIFAMWWFLVIILVTIVIVIFLARFQVQGFDTNDSHARVLYNRLFSCLVDNGYLVEDIKNLDIADYCALDKGVLNEKFYFEISDSSGVLSEEGGLKNSVIDCELRRKGVEVNKEVGCYLGSNLVSLEDGITDKLKILTISINEGGRE